MKIITKLPVFTSFNVLGREFPSEDSMVMILIDLKNSENTKRFCLNHHISHNTLDCKFNPDKYLSRLDELCPEIIPILELRLKRFPIYQKMCEILGISFPVLWQSMCIVMWFDFRVPKMEHDPMLEKYPEYKNALDFACNFDDVISTLAETNSEIEQLLQSLLDIEVEVLSISKLTKKGYRPILCPNPKCRKSIMLSPTDSRRHCGANECERYYNTNSKRKNNPKKGWVEDPSQTGLCAGTCGSVRRKLNSDRICKQCCPKKF
jgi:hypothetical protein